MTVLVLLSESPLDYDVLRKARGKQPGPVWNWEIEEECLLFLVRLDFDPTKLKKRLDEVNTEISKGVAEHELAKKVYAAHVDENPTNRKTVRDCIPGIVFYRSAENRAQPVFGLCRAVAGGEANRETFSAAVDALLDASWREGVWASVRVVVRQLVMCAVEKLNGGRTKERLWDVMRGKTVRVVKDGREIEETVEGVWREVSGTLELEDDVKKELSDVTVETLDSFLERLKGRIRKRVEQ